MSKKLMMMVAATMIIMSCKTSYQVASIERSRILVDARYDHHQDEKAVAFLTHYKRIVDSIMSPVVGQSAKYMNPHRPESELSNLITDIMVWASKDYNEQVDFGVYNIGGMRADLPKGDVTYGNVLDIAPFENKIAFATLSGAEVLELFSQMASIGGDGVSHSVRMVITKDGQLVSATLNGEPHRSAERLSLRDN
jgi:5''-nucleotidase/2'',3''-cyclic phosphodiesterase and related esterases